MVYDSGGYEPSLGELRLGLLIPLIRYHCQLFRSCRREDKLKDGTFYHYRVLEKSISIIFTYRVISPNPVPVQTSDPPPFDEPFDVMMRAAISPYILIEIESKSMFAKKQNENLNHEKERVWAVRISEWSERRVDRQVVGNQKNQGRCQKSKETGFEEGAEAKLKVGNCFVLSLIHLERPASAQYIIVLQCE